MKLEIARGLFLALSLSVTAVAAAAWQEPGPRVLHTQDCQGSLCPSAPLRKANSNTSNPDGNLLLFMFGLRQAMKGEQ